MRYMFDLEREISGCMNCPCCECNVTGECNITDAIMKETKKGRPDGCPLLEVE